jgi:threonine/homoserine/homoserine lactone efflux protein
VRAFLPQFVNPSAGDAARQTLRLGTIDMLLALVVYGLVGYCAGRAGRWLRTRDTLASRLRG